MRSHTPRLRRDVCSTAATLRIFTGYGLGLSCGMGRGDGREVWFEDVEAEERR